MKSILTLILCLVRDDGDGDATPFVIGSTGNVGVGTTVPLQPLHVAGQCVTGDTRLRRRRRRNHHSELDRHPEAKPKDLDSSSLENAPQNDDNYIYDEVRIDAIQPGDEILSLNEETGLLEYQSVNALMDMGVKDIYKLTTASGKTIRTTGNHPYLVQKSSFDTNAIYKLSFKVNSFLARKFYFSVLAKQKIYAPALGGESIAISEEGWHHLQDKARSKLNMISRYFALAKVPVLLSSKEAIVQYEKRGDSEFWVFKGAVDNVLVKAIVRSYKGGAKHFYSVVWQGEIKEEENKEGAASRLYPQCGGMVTPQLQDKYTIFMNGVSSVLMAQSKGVFDKLITGTKINARPNKNTGTWTKVSELKEGDCIATLSSSVSLREGEANEAISCGAHFERITKIELLAPEQVWDIEIANTHNFVGNDIIAHNTYLNGNVGIGTTFTTTAALTVGKHIYTVSSLRKQGS